MAQALVQQFQQQLGESQFYEAHQSISTAINRFIPRNQPNPMPHKEKATSLILMGFRSLIEKKQLGMAVDLAERFIALLEQNIEYHKSHPADEKELIELSTPKFNLSKTTSSTALEIITSISEAFPEGCDEHIRFLKKAVAWSKKIEKQVSHESESNEPAVPGTSVANPLNNLFSGLMGTGKTSKKAEKIFFGDATLHRMLASAYWKRGDEESLSYAHNHFICCNSTTQHAKLLVDWAEKGKPEERDLFIARAVFQLISLGKLSQAKLTYIHFLNNYRLLLKSKPENTFGTEGTSLTHFLKLLFEALIDKKSYDLVVFLAEKYAYALWERDASFRDYLDSVCLAVFDKPLELPSEKAANQGRNSMDNLMNMFSFLMGPQQQQQQQQGTAKKEESAT